MAFQWRTVANSLGRNRASIDLAVGVPFVLLYCLVAATLARMLWRRYPPAENGWIAGALMTLFLSLMFAAGATLLGEVWCGIAEGIRIGNDHISYRANRL